MLTANVAERQPHSLTCAYFKGHCVAPSVAYADTMGATCVAATHRVEERRTRNKQTATTDLLTHGPGPSRFWCWFF